MILILQLANNDKGYKISRQLNSNQKLVKTNIAHFRSLQLIVVNILNNKRLSVNEDKSRI